MTSGWSEDRRLRTDKTCPNGFSHYRWARTIPFSYAMRSQNHRWLMMWTSSRLHHINLWQWWNISENEAHVPVYAIRTVKPWSYFIWLVCLFSCQGSFNYVLAWHLWFSMPLPNKKKWEERLIFLGSYVCFQGTKEDTKTEKPCYSKMSSSFFLVILCHLLLQEEVLISEFYSTVGEILALTIKVTGAFRKHSNHVFLCTNCNLLKMACLCKMFHWNVSTIN